MVGVIAGSRVSRIYDAKQRMIMIVLISQTIMCIKIENKIKMGYAVVINGKPMTETMSECRCIECRDHFETATYYHSIRNKSNILRDTTANCVCVINGLPICKKCLTYVLDTDKCDQCHKKIERYCLTYKYIIHPLDMCSLTSGEILQEKYEHCFPIVMTTSFVNIVREALHTSTTEATNLINQYLLFMLVKALYEDSTNEDTYISPYIMIDQVWHLHMMNPNDYHIFCLYLVGMNATMSDDSWLNPHKVIQHRHIDMYNESDEVKQRRRHKGLILLSQANPKCGKLIDVHIWSDNGDKDIQQIFVKTLAGNTIAIDVDLNALGIYLMYQLDDKLQIPVVRQQCVYNGRSIEPSKTLKEQNIMRESTVHLFLRMNGC